MRVGYSCIKTTLSVCSKRVVMVAGLMVLPLTARLEKKATAEPIPTKIPEAVSQEASALKPQLADPRTTRLRRFLSTLHCPVLSLAEDFVHAADENQLDWRLLPSISVIESGGGKAYRNNNIFGWNNGAEPFPSIRAGLNTVAFKLGRSPLYRNRDVIGKLRIYNPDQTYAEKVVNVMNRISPRVDLRPVSRVVRQRSEYVYAAD